MNRRKIDAMHYYYGFGDGCCSECQHFVKKTFGKTYHKCLVYGNSNSESTDWRCSYPACGLIDKPFPHGESRIATQLTRKAQEERPVPGQMMMEI